jgi:hypothetical protein
VKRRGKAIEWSVPQAVKLEDIDEGLRPASEMRAGLDSEALLDYSQSLTELPPAKLMCDYETGTYWVVDGAHTITAHKGMEQHHVQAIVVDGDYLAAWEAASQQNTKHGVRIRNADKRARLKRACEMLPDLVKDWPWSANRLAAFCGVGMPLANEVLLQFIEDDVPRTDARGITRSASWTDARKISHANGRAVEEEPDVAPADDAPSPSPPLPPRPQPSRFDVLTKLLDENRVLLSSVDAPATEVRKGWGGFNRVVTSFNETQRRQLHANLVGLVESLREWIEHLEEVTDVSENG